MTLHIEAAGKTDIGCVRTNNEDSFDYDSDVGIYVVCDGMGGALAGEVASRLAVDCVLRYFRESSVNKEYPPFGKKFDSVSPAAQALASAIQMANNAVHESGSRHAGHHGMGSTIVAVFTNGQGFHIGHVGDSRIYLVRNGTIQQLTNDHSLVMEQVRRGLITREEAEKSELQNIIIRALGSEETVEPDVDDIVAMPGDVLLLATDGLTKHANDERLLEVITASPSMAAACDNLIQVAKDDGGDDNITCLLLRVRERSGFMDFWRKVFSVLFPGGKA
jgi:serine/threonine protein phosphatase PrpC